MRRKVFMVFLAVSVLLVLANFGFAQQTWEEFVERYLSLSQEEQEKIRASMTPEAQAYLDELLAQRSSSQAKTEPDLVALPDPGNLTAYRDKVGQTFRFLVTGSTEGKVWGTGIYTDDSHLGSAAVHAGVLKPGETGVVTVTVLPGQSSYQGSTSFGVTSMDYGAWYGSYRFETGTSPTIPAKPTITAGVPTKLVYTVVARNLSGVPVVNPVIKDNGQILNNDQAVKTGGNQDNILEVGETWTWTYEKVITGQTGIDVVNTATIEGPDDANLDTDLSNNRSSATVTVVAPPGKYDLAVTKTVTVQEISQEEIEIGERRTEVLNECNTWKAAQSGGYLGTEDTWDISAMPVGTVFDFRYNAYSVPDRFVVQYPAGVTVLDTGWRGEQSYVDNKPHLYPGGLAGSGGGQVDGIFTKGQANSFKVIVYGPEEDTRWEYEVRGNCPQQ